MLPALAVELAAFALFAFALAFRRFFVCGAPSICGLKSFGKPRRDIIHIFSVLFACSLDSPSMRFGVFCNVVLLYCEFPWVYVMYGLCKQIK